MLEFLAGEGGLSILDVNPGLIIWTAVTFLVVFVTLRFFAWNPIVRALDARAEKIHKDIDRAEGVRKEAETKLEEYLEKLNAHRQEGQDIIAEARKSSEQLKQEMIETAQKETEAIKLRGIRDIQLAMDKALEQYHQDLARTAVSIAAQILGKTLSAEDHQLLIREAAEKVKSLN